MTDRLGPMAQAVDDALRTAPVLPRDAAAVKLARRYAELIDNAAPAAKYRPSLRVMYAAIPVGAPSPVTDAYDKIKEALAEHSVASDLGPKLLAVLTSLGMTGAGRSAKGGAADGPRVPDDLARLRAERGNAG